MKKPIILFPDNPSDFTKISILIENNQYFDHFEGMTYELVKINFPSETPTSTHVKEIVLNNNLLNNSDQKGCFVYYPWKKQIHHILSEDDFIKVRTNRNRNKITEEEQNTLKGKTVAIVGLSVGQTIAYVLSTERICGKLVLADFDSIELSNLNRLKTSLDQLNMNKAIITAQSIWEMDPFLEIEIFENGVNQDNIEDFKKHKVDLIIEECDSLEIKYLVRLFAKKNKIPVIMETNDKCLIDIERFDLEPDLPILYNVFNNYTFDEISQLSPQARISLVMKLVGFNNLSNRAKESLPLIGKELRSWPQLASSVFMGAGIVGDLSRKILLNSAVKSGRFYVDIESLFDIA